ncbi:MAG: hypothetical protein WDW38_007432 [Sanguina aurantia]
MHGQWDRDSAAAGFAPGILHRTRTSSVSSLRIFVMDLDCALRSLSACQQLLDQPPTHTSPSQDPGSSEQHTMTQHADSPDMSPASAAGPGASSRGSGGGGVGDVQSNRGRGGEDFEAFKAVQRAIVAASKLSKANKLLTAAQELAASARQLVRPHPAEQQRRCVLVSVDVEWWEKDQARVLELGWSCWDNAGRLAVSRHWIVEEWLYTNNGKYVPNHKHDFAFGASETGPLAHGVAQLTQDLAFAATVGLAPQPPPPPSPSPSQTRDGTRIAAPQEPPRFLADGSFGRYRSEGCVVGGGVSGSAPANGAGSAATASGAVVGASAGCSGAGSAGMGGGRDGGANGAGMGGGNDGGGDAGVGGGRDDGGSDAAPAVLLVGHGMSQDLSMMGSLGVVLPAGVILADTQKLAWAAMGGLERSGARRRAERGEARMGLQALLKSLDMAPTKLHNAGNDALWTLRAALALLGA